MQLVFDSPRVSRVTILSIFILLYSSNIVAKDNNLQLQNKLVDCELKINISPSKKYDAQNKIIADSLKEVEIVWFNGRREPKRVFLVCETLSSGRQVEYFVPSEQYTAKTVTSVYFPDWAAKKGNRFYYANCFDSVMRSANSVYIR